ncbi:uncharacterized protein [Rutidosis leptorrhynchoides]|uniref:uncharacterized protein n=1 Tax=Rutidosis leptorrhynchoides TaxID=125765 RepID=UPI003A998F52
MDPKPTYGLGPYYCLSTVFNHCIYPSVAVGDGNHIPVVNTGHSVLPNVNRPLHLSNVLVTPNIVKNLISVRRFARDNKVSVTFDEFGFSVKDYLTHRLLLRCDSTGDLYPFTNPTASPTHHALITTPSIWHQRLGHPSTDVFRRLISNNSIKCNNTKSPALCHACQLGKHVRLPFSSSVYHVNSLFDIVHSDLWTSPIPSLSDISSPHVTTPPSPDIPTPPTPPHPAPSPSPPPPPPPPQNTTSTHPMVTRYRLRTTKLVQRLNLHVATPSPTPKSYSNAFNDPNWHNAMNEEYNALIKNGTWTLVPRPTNTNIVRSMWLFKQKFNADGTLSRYKARLVANGRSQQIAYSDADWAGCPSTCRSTSGYCVFLGNNLLSWSSKRQQTPSRSSAEAEYRGVANAVAETCWIRNLLRELHCPLSSATLVYCDNISAVYMSGNPVQHQRTKHIEIDIHFVRDLVLKGHVRVLHVPSRYQFADIFTKGLPTALFDEFRCSLSVRSAPATTAGGC